MRSKLTTLLTVIGAVTVLVLAANTVALATTGQALLAGKINTASKLTSITRTTPGTGLQVKTRSTLNSPFAVNGKGKVANLNADSVDGFDSTALRNRTYVFTKNMTVAANYFEIPLTVPNGTYTFGYSAFLSAGAGYVYCEIRRVHNSVTSYVAVTQFDKGTNKPGLSGSGVITKTAGDSVTFECGANTTFTSEIDIPFQVALSPTTIVGGNSSRISGR